MGWGQYLLQFPNSNTLQTALAKISNLPCHSDYRNQAMCRKQLAR